MDPLSISAGVIAVTQQLFRIQKAFASKNDKARAAVEDAIGDLHVYVDILNEINSTMFSFQGTMPPASRSCLELCFNRASKIANLMSKGEQKSATMPKNKTTLADLEYAMQQFRQAVSLLRDVIMEYGCSCPSCLSGLTCSVDLKCHDASAVTEPAE